jgi:hypothetical protein
MPHLRVLRLAGANLTGSLPMPGTGVMEELVVSNNRLSGNLPTTLPPSLRVLDAAGNYLAGQLQPNWGSNTSSLQRLRLSDNLLTGLLPGEARLTDKRLQKGPAVP